MNPIKFQNSFQELPPFLYHALKVTPLTNPKLVTYSAKCLELIDQIEMSDDLSEWLLGNKRISNDQSIATRYCGHQFGHWAGQLGDGRAISLGEVINKNNERYEVQIKGSGLTPFSRMGDGKAVTRSCIREFLCSEAMFGLNIPTTRALAVFEGTERVYRECVEKEATTIRVAPSFLRFGHFELAAAVNDNNLIRELINYTIKYFYQNCTNGDELFLEIVKSTAKLLACWQAVGFCHGVMNTDNMSILGITLDYGPFGFMEDFDLNHICNHSDEHGRYRYNNQPDIAFWNLQKLAVVFTKICDPSKIESHLAQFPTLFKNDYYGHMQTKLGVNEISFVFEFISLMQAESLDYTYTLRELSNVFESKDIIKKLGIKNSAPAISFLNRLKEHSIQDRSSLKKINPKYVLKNYIAEAAIRDFDFLQSLLPVLYNPYLEHPEFEKYALPTPNDQKHLEVSCSS
ncbi:MAG: YdiU family protein [Bacteriovoracaceae bacterium]